MEEQIPLGFIGILLGVFAFAFLIGVGVIYLKQRRIQRLKNPRKDYYRSVSYTHLTLPTIA